jgi:hypothetical protein
MGPWRDLAEGREVIANLRRMLIEIGEPTNERSLHFLNKLDEAADISLAYWATELRKLENAERRAK